MKQTDQPSSQPTEKKRSNADLQIMEWRFNQFLGEKIDYDAMR